MPDKAEAARLQQVVDELTLLGGVLPIAEGEKPVLSYLSEGAVKAAEQLIKAVPS